MAVAPGRREHGNQRDENVLLSVHVWERNTLQKVEVFKERVLHIKSGVLLSFGVKFVEGTLKMTSFFFFF